MLNKCINVHKKNEKHCRNTLKLPNLNNGLFYTVFFCKFIELSNLSLRLPHQSTHFWM